MFTVSCEKKLFSHTNRWLTYIANEQVVVFHGKLFKLPEGSHPGSHRRLTHAMTQEHATAIKNSQPNWLKCFQPKLSINSAIQGTSRCIWPGSPPSLAHLVRWAATALLCPRWSPRNWGKDRTRHHLRWGLWTQPWKIPWFIVVYHHHSSFPSLTQLFSDGNSFHSLRPGL